MRFRLKIRDERKCILLTVHISVLCLSQTKSQSWRFSTFHLFTHVTVSPQSPPLGRGSPQLPSPRVRHLKKPFSPLSNPPITRFHSIYPFDPQEFKNPSSIDRARGPTIPAPMKAWPKTEMPTPWSSLVLHRVSKRRADGKPYISYQRREVSFVRF